MVLPLAFNIPSPEALMIEVVSGEMTVLKEACFDMSALEVYSFVVAHLDCCSGIRVTDSSNHRLRFQAY